MRQALISDFIYNSSDKKVLVVGDLMQDNYWHGTTQRISPEAPVPIVHIQKRESRVGGAGNVALNVSSLGITTYLLGLVGDDMIANKLEKTLISKGVYCNLLRLPNCKTSSKTRILSHHQQLMRLDIEDYYLQCEPDQLVNAFKGDIHKMDVVIFSDYAKGTLKNCSHLIHIARNHDIPIIVDPKGNDLSKYRGATLITPNLAEFEAVVGKCNTNTDIAHKAQALCEQFDFKSVLVTRGEQGMTLITKHNEPFHLHTKAREIYDVTGAGDTVVATIGAALSANRTIHEAIELANLAAGIVVGKLGTATVSIAELETAVLDQKHYKKNSIIYAENEMLTLIKVARSGGKKIIMTNGCFDILHPGHIKYLEEARSLGDILIVAVNDDNSVRRLKGKSRPINSLDTRLRMLSALKCVDFVIPFSEDSPKRLIGQLCPDVLVKGGDYIAADIAGAQCVTEAGGEVKILDFLSGYSTTNIIKKIEEEA